jgi:sulfite exporter TauE/SafE
MEYTLALLGGLLGSAHCVGMCGGFVVTLGVRGRTENSAVLRQLLYASGRVCTYTLLGVIAGFIGQWMGARFASMSAVRPWLTLVAGIVIVVIGLDALGWLPRRSGTLGSCLGSSLFADLHGASSRGSVFLGGVINGLLPCGLVYAYLSLACSSAGLLSGGLIMALFGLGTVPALALLGAGAARMSCSTRARVLRLGGLVMLVGAALLIRHSAVQILWPGTTAPYCPFCSTSDGGH